MFKKATQWFMVLVLVLFSSALVGPLAFAQDDSSTAELEITITWPGMPDGSILVIGGISFDLSTAEIDDTLQIGEMARIHASLGSDGVWVVREVSRVTEEDDNANDNEDDGNVNDNDDNANDNEDDDSANDNEDNDNSDDDDGDSIEFRGRLDEIGAGFIVVAGVRFDTSGLTLEDLFVGAPVRVHAREINGVLVAHEVDLDLDDDDDIVIGDDCVPAMPAGWTTYTIQAGDTLSAIANGSDTSVAVLMLVNCIADPSLISAGATIFVPFTPVIDEDDNSNDNEDESNDNDDDNANDNEDESNDNDDNANDNGDDDDNANDNEDESNDNDDDESNDNGGDSDDDDDDDENDNG